MNQKTITFKKAENSKKAGLVSLLLIFLAILIFGIFIYAMINLINESKAQQTSQNSTNSTKKSFNSFSEFLNDVKKRVGAKEKAKDSVEKLKYLKFNMCELQELSCLGIYENGVKFKITNTIAKPFYHLKNVKVAIHAENKNCSQVLQGPIALKGGETENYTADCIIDDFMYGNITFNSISKDDVPNDFNGKFFIRKE